MSTRKLYRSVEDRRIGGVCGGLAEFLDIDVTIIRIIFLGALILAGSGGLLYLIIWIVAPEKPDSPRLNSQE